MKRILSVLLTITVVLSFAGCSSKPAGQKSEEEIRAEIKAEMEAEEKKKEELKAELKAEMEAEEKKKEEEKAKEEKVIGPVNMAIKNYNGEGLERLAKRDVDLKGKYKLSGKEVSETLAIFGEVTNVKIGYIKLFTEGNYALMEKFDSLKDTELTIKRGSGDDALITVSFYDGGLREHTLGFTSSDIDLSFMKVEDKAELTAGLDDKYKAPTAYKDKSDLILKSLGLSQKEFESSSTFNNIKEEVDDFDGSKYYQVENDPLGYNFILRKEHGSNIIYEVYITTNEGYDTIKDDVKCSFFGVDFDMSIYQARYNVINPKDNISVELVEHYDEAGKLMGIKATIADK